MPDFDMSAESKGVDVMPGSGMLTEGKVSL